MDIRTFLVIISLTNFLIFSFFVYYSLSSRSRNRIFEIYATGRLLLGFAWLLLSQQGNISHELSVGLGNVLLILGVTIEMYVISSYQHLPQQKSKKLFIFLGFFASLVFIFAVQQSDNIRIAFASFINAVILLVGSLRVLSQKKEGKIHYLLGGIYLFLAITLYARGIVASFFRFDMNLLSQGVVQSLTFISFLLVTYIGSILLMLLLKEQDDKTLHHKAEELNNTNKELEATIASKDRFLSIIAHDLRGPIGNIAQMAELLNDAALKLTKQEKDDLQKSLFRNSSKTFELLENLLSWGRAQSGSFQVKIEPIHLQALVNQVVFQLQGQANDKSITIHTGIESHVKVMADFEMIQVVVRNLLSNAIKFTHGEGKIYISSASDGDRVRITVKDTGKGIPFDIQQHLFDAEFSHSTLGTNKEKGTGFGLKICKEFVEKNQGRMEIESIPDMGSTFSFTLPPVMESVN